MWLRVDRVRRSLEAPYTGPYEVVRRHPKYFILKLPQGETSVSIDILKPAFLTISSDTKPKSKPLTKTSPSANINEPTPVSTSDNDNSKIAPRRTTRSGRSVKFNPYPEYSYY